MTVWYLRSAMQNKKTPSKGIRAKRCYWMLIRVSGTMNVRAVLLNVGLARRLVLKAFPSTFLCPPSFCAQSLVGTVFGVLRQKKVRKNAKKKLCRIEVSNPDIWRKNRHSTPLLSDPNWGAKGGVEWVRTPVYVSELSTRCKMSLLLNA